MLHLILAHFLEQRDALGHSIRQLILEQGLPKEWPGVRSEDCWGEVMRTGEGERTAGEAVR